jgi:hypothetical protein
MIHVYINKPNPHIEIHRDPSCKRIRQNLVEDQRVIKITIENVSEILHNFVMDSYCFDNQPITRDMWLEIDFGYLDFEIAVANYIGFLVGKKYPPLAKNPPKFCC